VTQFITLPGGAVALPASFDSLALPGGHAIGFTSWEFSMGAKWLELLKQIAPGLN
jgi:hypothetical protein